MTIHDSIDSSRRITMTMARNPLFSLLCLALAVIISADAGDDGDVLVLTADNFEREVCRWFFGIDT